MEIAETPAAVLGLPTLAEVLRSFGGRAFLDIELKVGGLEQETITLLRECPPQNGYVVSSFLPEVLAALHRFDPTSSLGFLFERRDELDCWPELPVAWVIPQFELADQPLIEQMQAAGKKVMVWTVNHAESIRDFAEWGVDAIISDETELAVKVLSCA